MAPNPVLCYGAGEMGKIWAADYLRMGINVVGFIDKYKTGQVTTRSGPLPVYSIQAAAEQFQEHGIVVITLSDMKLYDEIRSDLSAAGMTNIVSCDFTSWTMAASEKCWCRDFQTVQLHPGGLAHCCYKGMDRLFLTDAYMPGLSVKYLCTSFFEKTRYYHEQAQKGRIPLYCFNCPYLERNVPPAPRVELINFGATVNCNLACIYCPTTHEGFSKMPYTAKEYGEDFLSLLEYIEANDCAVPGARVEFGGGEISILPGKEQLLDFALTHSEFRYTFFSNCVLYDEKIADVLSINPENSILCDLDAGTPKSYFLVKGRNCFNQVVDNLKKYSKHGTIQLKYILIPGFNTSDEDYTGTIALMRQLGVSELILTHDLERHEDVYAERQLLFEAARFQKVLAENGLNTKVREREFGERRTRVIEQLFRQM